MFDTITRLNLFGPPGLKDDNARTVSVRGRKSIALLSYLALTQPRIHSREQLADMFWPGLAEKDARNNLRVSVSRINKILSSSEAPLVITDRLTITLNPKASLINDVLQFNTLLGQVKAHNHVEPKICDTCVNHLESAVALYTAEFMEGFELEECEKFEQWQQEQREQLRLSAVRALTLLARQAEFVQDHSAVEHLSRHLVNIAPYAEQAHRMLMSALAYSGDYSEALSHYSLMKRTLQQELGVKPEEETLDLVASIRSGKLLANSEPRESSESGGSTVMALHNLPLEKTPYIGNRTALSTLCKNLQSQRLVTLTGIGGVGKTRIAVQASHSLIPDYPGGIWMVKLASMNSRTDFLSNLASVLGVQLLPGDEAISSICNQLDDQKRLLILDNFEHLILENDVVSFLLDQSPNLTILVTSRQRLVLTGEAVCAITGLQCSDTEQESDAYRLFIDVAKRTRIDFEPGTDTREYIRKIVRLVDGHPLAIVIAAGWVDGLSCRQIYQELETGLAFLETDSIDIPERQRSIKATFNYSWKLLDDEDQALFSALSVFRGGFDRRAAQIVAGASFQKLTRLVRKSLIQYLPDTERYEMHELMRQYAEQQLNNSEIRNEITQAHSSHYLQVLNELSASQSESTTPSLQNRFTEDFNNISKAWYFALAEEQREPLTEAITGLRIMCSLGAHSHGLLELLQPALPLVENPAKDSIQPNLVLNLLLAMGFAYRYTSGYFARELGDIFARAYALTDELETSPELFVVLYGRWSFNFTSGNLSDNLPILQQWRERLSNLDQNIASQSFIKDALFVLPMLEGPQLQCMGEFTEARKVLQSGLRLEDSGRYAAIMGNYGLNFAVSGRHWLAINQCISGLVEECHQTIQDAHDIAEHGKNPYLRMFVAFGQLVIATLQLDTRRIQLHANAVNALVSRYRIFHAFQHHADIYLAYANYRQDNRSGLKKLQSLIDSGNGIPVFRLFDVQLFADALVHSGRSKEAIQYLHTFTEPAQEKNIKFSIVESSRIEGDAYSADGDINMALECYEKAMSIADSQKAGLYRLRTGLSFARHLANLNRILDAITLLGPIVDSLPDCHGGHDYIKACELLMSLRDRIGS